MALDTRRAAPPEGVRGEARPLASYAGFVAVHNAAFVGALVAARLAGRKLASPGVGDVALFGVATHKLSRLLAKDKVTAALRSPFAEIEGDGGPAKVEQHPRGTGLRRRWVSWSRARTASTSGSRPGLQSGTCSPPGRAA
jgi:hypothetical protein